MGEWISQKGKWTLNNAWHFCGMPQPPFKYVTKENVERIVTHVHLIYENTFFGTGDGYMESMIDGNDDEVVSITRTITVAKGDDYAEVPHTEDFTKKWPPT